MILPMDGDEPLGWKPGKATAFLATPLDEGEPAFSPDGRWLAYHSRKSGSFGIYVRPFPGPGGEWQVSTGYGRFPMWSQNGKELFYQGDGTIMAVNYTSEGDSFRAENPRRWWPGQVPESPDRTLELHPDGQRFAVLKTPEAQAEANRLDRVAFIFNFFDELRRIAPIAVP